MIYNIYHETRFDYEGLVSFSHNIARLKPKNTPYQTVLNFSLEVNPAAFEQSDFVDMHGNINTHMLIREPHKSMSVVGRSRVEIKDKIINNYIATIKTKSMSYESSQQRLKSFNKEDISAKQFLFASKLIPNVSDAIKQYTLKSFDKKRDLFEAVNEFMGRIFEDFAFVTGFSDTTTPVEEIFDAKKGVCQDFAQFAIAALRSIGLPAKYMSGYIETLPPQGGEKLFGVDASHAWFAVYIPGAGWAQFDPTNNIIPASQHVVLGFGRDYHDISPLKGVVLSSGKCNLSVKVDVRQDYNSADQIFTGQSQS